MLTPTRRCFSTLMRKMNFLISPVCNALLFDCICLPAPLSIGNYCIFTSLYNTKKLNSHLTCCKILKSGKWPPENFGINKSPIEMIFLNNMNIFWVSMPVLMTIFFPRLLMNIIFEEFLKIFCANPRTFKSIYRQMVSVF